MEESAIGVLRNICSGEKKLGNGPEEEVPVDPDMAGESDMPVGEATPPAESMGALEEAYRIGLEGSPYRQQTPDKR